MFTSILLPYMPRAGRNGAGVKRSCLNLLTAEPCEAISYKVGQRGLWGPSRGGHVSNEQPTELGRVSLLFSHTRGVKD